MTLVRMRKRSRHIYFSVDLDFWLCTRPDVPFLERLIGAFGVGDVVTAVDHQPILPHVQRYWGPSKKRLSQELGALWAAVEGFFSRHPELQDQFLSLMPESHSTQQ